MNYLGSITLPFCDFSYILKLQRLETGVMGLRSAVIFDELLKTGEVTIDVEAEQMQSWMQDPYDPLVTAPLARNRSEAEEYDARFPDHPLSRLRQALGQVQRTLKVGREAQQEPRFEFRRPQPAQKPWWKKWVMPPEN